MKFLADMGISPRTVNWLKNQGYDAIHLIEQGLEKLEDEDILIKAQNEQRIILTVDLDFGSLLAMTQSSLPSVILFRLGNESREIIEARLTEVLEQCQNELLTGAIISVNDDAFRVRIPDGKEYDGLFAYLRNLKSLYLPKPLSSKKLS